MRFRVPQKGWKIITGSDDRTVLAGRSTMALIRDLDPNRCMIPDMLPTTHIPCRRLHLLGAALVSGSGENDPAATRRRGPMRYGNSPETGIDKVLQDDGRSHWKDNG